MLAAAACALLLCAAARCDQPPTSPTVTAALQPFVDSHSLAGAVTLIADKDRIISLDAVGFADLAAHRPMTVDALFWVASQSKPITATAFMMLIDEGKVSLDDPVAKYLPEFGDLWVAVEHDNDHLLLKRPVHPITVREILSHTSGLPFASAMEQPALDTLPLSFRARSYAMTPLQFQPGTKYQYSNAGLNTAGRIIEVVSGEPYERFLQERLLDPLSMKDTTFWPTAKQLTRVATSYRPNDAKDDLQEITVGQLRYPLEDRTRHPVPAGGLFSTAQDLARFLRMVLNGGTLDGKRYLSEAAVKAMTSKQTPPAVPDGYGLGWGTDGTHFGHGGAFGTNMSIDSGRGIITVWLVQHAGYAGNGDRSQGAFQRAAEEVLRAQYAPQ
jgi:CubicO group peptidase (beta-lactamase class C family)